MIFAPTPIAATAMMRAGPLPPADNEIVITGRERVGQPAF
jgi:hypothetical protein